MIKLTLDTNCIINLLDFDAETPTSVDELSEIICYGLDGDVNINITTCVESDVLSDKDSERKNEMLRKIKMFPVIGTAFCIGTSAIGSEDFIASESNVQIAQKIQTILFPGLSIDDKRYKNKINDVDHLAGHVENNRDIFVTDDRGILRRQEKLKESLSITTMNPAQCLEYLDLRANKEILISEFKNKLISLRTIFMKAANNSNSDDLQEEYFEVREWLIKKLPKLQDGIVNFKFRTVTVPLAGNRLYYPNDIETIRHVPRLFSSLFKERTLNQKIEKMWGKGTPLYYSDSGKKVEMVENLFGEPLDLITAYLGYLEND